MFPDVLGYFQDGFETKVAALAAIAFCTVLPFCLYKRAWPEIGAAIIMAFGVTGAAIGLKIVILALLLPDADIGPLADERYALVVGGFMTFVVSLREAIEHWRLVVNI